MSARDRLLQLLARNANGVTPSVPPSPEVAARLATRLGRVPYFAHGYPFILNMDHGRFGPRDLAEFAHANELAGLCLHISDGGERSLRRMDGAALESYRNMLDGLGLRLHLEISSTERDEVDEAARIADALGTDRIRLYARHEGLLSTVTERIYADLGYAMEVASARDLQFDYEQHEDLRAEEIAALVQRIGDRRLGVLFDYTNSWNAHEEPLAALRVLAPWIRQVHIKGGRKTIEAGGWGQFGVPQGGDEDELPAALLLYELLLLGDDRPQVIAFALESEVGYHAPPLRRADEPRDPYIAWRSPSETPLDAKTPLEQLLRNERRWAQQQVTFNRTLAAEMRSLAALIADEPPYFAAPPHQETSMQYESLRREMIATCNFMNDRGINQGTSGNLSVRVDEGFLITPSGVPYAEMVPEDIVLMHLDASHHGERKPSSEWRFHRDLMVKKPEVGAVIHLHSRFCAALSMLRQPIPAVHYMIAAAGGPTIPCVPYVTWGTQELADLIVQALSDRLACLLANHGMVAIGPNLKKAAALAVEVETLAAQYWHARVLGDPFILPDDEIARVIEKFKTYGQVADDTRLPGCC